jgi:hypothetical protein
VPGELTGGNNPAESGVYAASGTTWTVTVGCGGASVSTARNGKVGASSVFGPITSQGGGAGGGYDVNSYNLTCAVKHGGNGGGANAYAGLSGTYGGATVGYSTAVGFPGGTGINSYGPDPTGLGGGGGGAGGPGGNATGTTTGVGGAGGIGIASSITGSAVYRAGGGGGSVLNNGSGGQTAGLGGQGGGGPGGNDSSVVSGTAGTANTGGGGGGGIINYSGVSGAGGKGVVIVSTPSPVSSTTGSPTTSTVNGRSVYVFNSSGSITF